ncbi:MAG: glutamate--tRNA ligase [Opitutales bacterium]
MSKVRVRFAPSPTGFFHIGSARTALFNWLYARHTGGTFVLRIEDTDKERNTQEYLDVLLSSMKWLGLEWDEGPEVGGEYGPYFQSQRDDIYLKYLQILRDNGRAYDKDGAVFFKISQEKQVLADAVYGNVERQEEKDFPIFRSDGSPVFHFVNVVDDIEMKITHVIRGQDHLTNTNKHLELFKAFGAEVPQFAHIPLILKQEGSGKMSKRDKGALIEEYTDKFFLPEAVVNFLSLLGWNPKNGKEIMPTEEIISLFDFDNIVKSNARFDEKKMNYFNQEHLRALDIDKFEVLVKKAFNNDALLMTKGEDFLKGVLALCQAKVANLTDINSLISYFFTDEFEFNEQAKTKLLKKENFLARMSQCLELIENAQSFDKDSIYNIFAKAAEDEGIKASEFFPILRFATTGQAGGPELFPMLSLFGKDEVIKRIKATIQKF